MEEFARVFDAIEYYAQQDDSVALVFVENGESVALTYAGLQYEIEKRAEELLESGKHCIGVVCSNTIKCVETIFAAIKNKMQLVMLGGESSDELLKARIAATDCELLYCEDRERHIALSKSLNRSVKHSSGSILFFTSGTTGSSKAVELSDNSLIAAVNSGNKLLPLEQSDTLLCGLPLSHIFGFTCGLLWGLSCGAAVALNASTRYFLRDFSLFKPTAVSLVPLQLDHLLKRSECLNPELKTVLIGASDCPQNLIDDAKAKKLKIAVGYGLTECSSGVALGVGSDPNAMTVCPGVEVEIASDGEILIKAPSSMMRGYYNNPLDTNRALRNGALHTGDLGFFDELGLLHVSGRKKEMLVLKNGSKIFLPEHEKKLRDALPGEELVVTLAKNKVTLVLFGSKARKGEIKKAAKAALKSEERSKRIAEIVFKQEPMPRTASGKIMRREIEKMVGSDDPDEKR